MRADLLVNSGSFELIASADIGSSGTLVGAALQTVGMFSQSDVLDYMASSFAGSLSALVFVIAVLGAGITLALTNNYKPGLWLLIGPGLFSAVVFTRVEVDAANWKFGQSYRNPDAVSRMAGIDPDAEPARVAGLYVWFDRLISSVVRSMEDTLTLDDSDTMFLVWSSTYGAAAEGRSQEAGLRHLLHNAFRGSCKDVFSSSRKMFDPTEQYVDRCNAARNFESIMGDGDNHRITLTKEAQDYVRGLYLSAPQLLGDDTELVSQNNCEQRAMLQRCEDRFCPLDSADDLPWCGDGNETIPQGILDQTQDGEAELEFIKRIQDGCRNEANLDANRQQFMNDVCEHHRRVTSALQATSGGSISEAIAAVSPQSNARELAAAAEPKTCREVWGLIYAGLIKESMDTYDRTAYEAAGSDPDTSFTSICDATTGLDGPNAALGEIMGIGGDGSVDSDDPTQIVRGIAKRILGNEMRHASLSGIIEDWSSTSESTGAIGFENESEVESYERVRVAGREWQEKTRLMVVAGSLPYYQGLGLYFLTMLFPFWAILLLIPGRHGAFLLWFQYYAYFKFWDVGYACVMMMDEFLSTLFVAEKNGQISDALYEDMTMAFSMLEGLDPSFHVSQYYNIMATSIMAIPVIMSYIILGGASMGSQLVSEGINKVAGRGGPVAAQRGYGGVAGTTQQSIRSSQAITESQSLASGFVKAAVRGDLSSGRVFTEAAASPPITSAMVQTYLRIGDSLEAGAGFNYLRSLSDNLSNNDSKWFETMEDYYWTSLYLQAGKEFMQGFRTQLGNTDLRNKQEKEEFFNGVSQQLQDKLSAAGAPVSVDMAGMMAWYDRVSQGYGAAKVLTEGINLVQNSPEAVRTITAGARDQYLTAFDILSKQAEAESLTNPVVLSVINYSAAWGIMPLPVTSQGSFREATDALIRSRVVHLQALQNLLK